MGDHASGEAIHLEYCLEHKCTDITKWWLNRNPVAKKTHQIQLLQFVTETGHNITTAVKLISVTVNGCFTVMIPERPGTGSFVHPFWKMCGQMHSLSWIRNHWEHLGTREPQREVQLRIFTCPGSLRHTPKA